MGFNLRRRALALATGAALLAGGVAAQAETLRMASLGQASPTTVFSIAVSQILKNELDYSTQLATGSPRPDRRSRRRTSSSTCS